MGRPVTVGRVLRAHGIRGEVVVRRYGETTDVLARGAKIDLEKGGLRLSLTVQSVRPHKKAWLVTFEGMGTRDEAEVLAGAAMFVDSEVLPPLEEGVYYDYQLLGLRVVTVEGKELGRVEDILETGAHDVLVARGPGGEVLIPSRDPVVQIVDLEGGRIVVDPPPGLIPEEEEKTGAS